MPKSIVLTASLALVAGCYAEPNPALSSLGPEGSTDGDEGGGELPTGSSTSGASPGSDSAPTTSGDDDSTDDDDGGDGGSMLDIPPPPDLCTGEASSTIYLMAVDLIPKQRWPGPTTIHRLDPDTLEVTELGMVDCVAAPISMTLAQDGTLWATMADLYDGHRVLAHIDPETLECERVVEQWPDDFTPIGLAFSQNPDGTEDLYLGGLDPVAFTDTPKPFEVPHALFHLDLETLELTATGTLPLVPNDHYQGADLVGIGDGSLLALFSGEAQLARFHPLALDEVEVQPVGATLGVPWAVAQWEGKVWLFSREGDGSKLQALDADTGELTLLSEDIGIQVVGTGVSTCAPFEPEG